MPRHGRRTFLRCSGALLGGIAVGTTVTAAERTDRFIVSTRGRADLRGLDVVHQLPGIDYAVVRGSERAVRRAVSTYAPDIELRLDDPAVNALAPTVDTASVTDEPFYGFQWDKQVLDVATAHETTEGEGTRVAIIDSGVSAGHPDLEVNEELSRNFTGDGLGAANSVGGFHGTHVGGIVAAQTNGTGVAGTAPATDLVDCRVFSVAGGASFGDVLAAILYSAAIDADVANLSLGAYPVSRQGLGQFYGQALNRTMTYANKEGTLLTIAAGNDAADLQHDKNLISLPNEGAQGLAVSATGPIGFGWGEPGLEEPPESPAIYTNFGTNAIDLGAPGGDFDPEAANKDVLPWYLDMVLNTITLPVFDDEGNLVSEVHTYAWVAGTSMAAPQVAGAAALVKSANPSFNANQVESVLKRAAEVPNGYPKTYYGSGFLNIVDAL